MPGLLLPLQIGSRVKPLYGSSPVEDDPLFGDAGADQFDPPVKVSEGKVPDEEVWHIGAPTDPNDTLQPEPGVNSMDEAEADRIARDPRFNTQLTPEEEDRFLEWKQQNAPDDSGYDYDLKGAFRHGLTRDPETGHMLDTYKKPNHATFSDQSVYAQIMPEKAGKWDENDQYIPASAQPQEEIWHIGGDQPKAEAPPDLTGDPSANAYGFGGRGDTYLERAKDRFYTGPDYNIAMNMLAKGGDIFEGIGAIIEGYGNDTFVSEIGAKARAAGKTIGGYIRDKMDPEWVKSQQKSALDFSENGMWRDPKSFVLGISGQLPFIAATLGIGSAAGVGLEIAGLSAPVATAGGLMVGGVVSTSGDAASSAADAIDAANLSPEERTKAERIAATASLPLSLAVGPFYAKLFHGGFGGVLGSLLATGVEEFTEEAGTEAAAQLGKKAVGLPFEWQPILESGVQGVVTGVGIGAGVGAVHKYGRAPTDPNVQKALDSNAESEAIRAQHEKSQQDKLQAQLDQHEAERDQLAMEQEAATPAAPGTPAGPPPEGVGKEGTDFVAGGDPTAKQEKDRENLMLGIVRHAAKMVTLQDRITAATDPAKRAKLVGEFQKRRAQRLSMIAELESYPDTPMSRGPVVPAGEPTPGVPGQGGGRDIRPGVSTKTPPTPAPALGTAQDTGYDLETAQKLGVMQNQMVLLQRQIQSTSDPDGRASLVQQFRALRKTVQNLHHQVQQGTTRPDPTKPIDAEFREISPGPVKVGAPTVQEVTGVETLPSGKLPPVALVSTPEGRQAGRLAERKARQQARVEAAAAKQGKKASIEVDRLAPQVHDLDTKLQALQEKIQEQQHKPTRSKWVGQFRKLTQQRRTLAEQLNEAIRRRDAVPTQLAIPGLEEGSGSALREPDYAKLARDLDRMMPGVGVDAAPVAPQDGSSPAEIGPIAEIFDKWVKKSQAAKAGWATRQAKKAQSPNDAGMQTEQPAEETGVTPPEKFDQPVKVDGTPDNNPPPAPAPVPDLPAETGHTASAGAELAAIRTRMPSRKAPPVPQAAPPAAEAVTGGVPTPAPAKAPLRGSPGPLAASPDPVEAERAKRNKPQTQEQFVQTAISMNEFKKQTEAQQPSRDVKNPGEVQLPDPNSPPWKVKEDADPPSTGILEAALQLEQQNPAKAELAARSARNVLARLLAKGPVNVDTVLAHLQANLLIDKGSTLDLLLRRLRGAFPATTDRPSKVMVDNTALPGGYQGLYDAKTDTVHIDLQQAEDVLHAVLHEIVHAAVATRLTNIGFQEQLLKIVNQAKQYWTDSGVLPAVDEVYGFTNLNEFLTEALTNTDFQTKLKSLFDAEFDTRNAISIWRKFKNRVAQTLGFQAKTLDRDLLDALLEFVPDGKFLTHENREATLAELDRLGLAEPQALMSTLNAVFRPKSGGPRDVLVSPRGRVMPKLMRKMSNYMINKSYAKFGQAYRDNTGQIQELGNWVERFFGLKDAMGGYAAAQQAKASQIVEVFKNATYNDNEGKVGKIMERSRMYMLDASKAANDPANAAGMLRPGANAAYAELQNLWNSLSPGQRDTYELVRDHGDEIRFRQINDMMVEIVRQMVGETEANQLQDYIVNRAPVVSNTGGRYNIDLSYHPIMSAQEIATQMRRLVPNPALQKKTADALKEVHSVIKQTPGPYFPLRRFGKFYVSLKSAQQSRVMTTTDLDNMIAADRATGDGTIQIIGTPTPVGGGRVKVTWRNEFYNEHENERDGIAEHAKLIDEWRTAGRTFTLADAKTGLKTDKSFERGGIGIANVESLRTTLENALGGPGSAGGKAASDAALQWFLERSPATSANKSRLQARNVAGASKDMLRAYAEYAYGTSFLQARIKYGPQLHRILSKDIPADVLTMQAGGNSRQGIDLAAIAKELTEREQLQMELAATDTQDHGSIMKLWVKAPAIAASFYLTGIATMIVNSYQTINMTIPELGKEFGFPSTTAALMGAYKDVFIRNVWATTKEVGRALKYTPAMLKSIATGKPTPSFRDPMQSAVQQMTGHLPDGEKDAMQALAEMRQLDFGLVADVQSVAFGNRAAGNLFTYLSEAAFILPQSIEAQNRVTTALATWRLHSKRMGLARGASVGNGMTQQQFDQLVKVTVDKIKTTQIDYARDNKAPMMQKEGLRAALVFQNYAMQQFYTITHNFLQTFRAETPQGRAEAIRFLGAWGATTIAVAGVAGIIKIEPIYLAMVALMWGLGSDEEDPEALLRTWMGKWNDDLRNLVLHGVPYSQFGVDTSRMGYSPVVPVDEMWKTYQNPNSGQKDWYSLIGKTLGGAPTDMIFKSVFGAASKAVADGDMGKAMEMLTPKAFGINDAVRAINYANSGVTTQFGNTVVPEKEITTKDIIVRGLGFTPSKIAEKQAQRHEGAFKSSVVKDRKYELLDRYAKTALAGGKVEGVVQEIIAFNKKNPLDALSKKSMLGAIKRRAKGAAMLERFGTEVRSKGDILRAQEIARKYGTGQPEMMQ